MIAAVALAAVAVAAVISIGDPDDTSDAQTSSPSESAATGYPSGGTKPEQPEVHEPGDETTDTPVPSPSTDARANATNESDADTAELDAGPAVERDSAASPTPDPISAPGSAAAGTNEPDWEELSRSIVFLTSWRCGHTGSGTIVGDGTYVLTNSHVAVSNGGAGCDLAVGLTDRSSRAPEEYLGSRLVIHDPQLDLALLRMLDSSGNPLALAPRDPIEMHARTLNLGEEIVTLGYSDVGGSTITITSGDYSGEVEYSVTGKFWKTSAAMGPGISGGAAFDSKGRFVGVPTGAVGANLRCESIIQSDCTVSGASLGLVLPADTVARWLEASGYGDVVAPQPG